MSQTALWQLLRIVIAIVVSLYSMRKGANDSILKKKKNAYPF